MKDQNKTALAKKFSLFVSIFSILLSAFFLTGTKEALAFSPLDSSNFFSKVRSILSNFKIFKPKFTKVTYIPFPTIFITITPALAPKISPTFIPILTPTLVPESTPTVTPTNTPTNMPSTIPTEIPPTDSTTINGSWEIQSVSSMKETKDKVCSQDDQTFIEKWVDKAKELGANYVAVETPYDNPSCGNALEYTQKWVDAIRKKGLKVWHRHMPLAFEGIYDTRKTKGDYFQMISNYIKDNALLFKEDDIFTPIPEPQNGGIFGITYCSQDVCIFENKENFNKWLREAIDVAENAFKNIGLGGKIKIGYYGFDGFVAWGSNNPDWDGILEDETIQKMGNLAIDHYPELIGQSMEQGLNEVMTKYPGVPIIISEWGSVGAENVEQQVIKSMGAAKRPGVVGFNYWHLGMGGNEALINDDFSNRLQFDEVQNFFKGK